jgi:surface polysaccharide O-acyltransferase-like enzyme
MITGIYVLLPVLKEWISNAKEENIRYFLSLFFVIQICGETLRAVTVTDEIHYVLDLIKIDMACGYIGYFMWGYYLTHVKISDKLCRWFYLGALPALVCNVLFGNYLAHRAGQPVGTIYDSFGIFTFVFVTALYLFTVNKVSTWHFGQKGAGIIKEIAGNTFGVYVMHIGLMEVLEPVGIHSMMIANIWGIPLFAVVCFVICSFAAAGLRRIPLIGKYIC